MSTKEHWLYSLCAYGPPRLPTISSRPNNPKVCASLLGIGTSHFSSLMLLMLPAAGLRLSDGLVLTCRMETPDSIALPRANPADVASIDAIITAAYDVISGHAEEPRDWDRERSLYLPGARLIPTAPASGATGAPGELTPQVLDIEGYIARVEPYFAANGFFEKEVARKTEQFGQIAHAWSTYESRRHPEDREPFMRGINSIELFHDGARWWIVTIYWQHESSLYPLPSKYLS